tara:strand:- start:384 stop:560 length:177 start_codon:yes stop_codon:yes gene_type:complete
MVKSLAVGPFAHILRLQHTLAKEAPMKQKIFIAPLQQINNIYVRKSSRKETGVLAKRN